MKPGQTIAPTPGGVKAKFMEDCRRRFTNMKTHELLMRMNTEQRLRALNGDLGGPSANASGSVPANGVRLAERRMWRREMIAYLVNANLPNLYAVWKAQTGTEHPDAVAAKRAEGGIILPPRREVFIHE